MFTEILVIDNFLENPDDYYEESLKHQYYLSGENSETTKGGINYKGKRTLFLQKDFGTPIINKIIKTTISSQAKINIDSDFGCLFHSLDKTIKFDTTNFHKDTSLFAGVIYINKNITKELKDCGTLIKTTRGDITIPYLYNRLVFYRSDILHCPLNGFGDDISNSRTTISVFLNNINITIRNSFFDKLI